MYTGKRDPEIPILVRRDACDEYIGKDGTLWIEIKIPFWNLANSCGFGAGTIMAKPEQVFFVNDRYNMNIYNQLMVNDRARIVCSVKDTNRTVVYSRKMTPDNIIDSLLTIEINGRYDRQTIRPNDLYEAFASTGLTMLEYIIRVNQGCIDWRGNPYIRHPQPYAQP